jgi:hypothetical protein
MFKKLKNTPLFTIIAITAIIAIEPETTKTIAAKSLVKKSQSSEVPCGKAQTPFILAEYNNRGGSVLPVYTGPKGKLYAILTREARGKNRRKYDDFSGGREIEDKHPMLSAAREFHEEAILHRTLGWDLDTTIAFLNPKTTNVIDIVAYSKDKNPNNKTSQEAKNVTYIVNFNTYAKQLFNNFYDALAAEKKYYRENHIPYREQSTVEKDRITAVLMDDLKEAIINSKSGNAVSVLAQVVDPKTNRFRKNKEYITLRPFLVAKLRPYFLDMPYDQGEHKKIRHYKVSYQ